ncbi:MAG TPA: hypothetical protein VKB93_07550 [Thermoanaerobaculia bacterium]|nr:hypothetical protein [Thermoanaerobaculia bacterium]
MTQQLGIVVVIDVEAALRAGQLEGCSYFFDNAGPFGTIGNGTDTLITAIHGTQWEDGSQASEQILNFLVIGVTSLPISLPRNYVHHRAAQLERQTMHTVRAMASGAAASNASVLAALGTEMPQYSAVLEPSGDEIAQVPLLDQTGEMVPAMAAAAAAPSDVAQLPPIITAITGDAVDEGIIFPAQYGSPDLVNGGWYWSATVATHTPKVWTYTLHILLHRLINDPSTPHPVWEPVRMTCDSFLNITNRTMRNGFTGGGTGILPVGVPWSVAP